MMQIKRTEEGQVMILLVLALVGMFAFAALAIDGGLIYSDRRIAQNAADASSLAGSEGVLDYLKSLGRAGTYENWNCANLGLAITQGNNAAIAHASVVDFIIDTDISDNNGVNTACFEVSNGSYIDKYIDVWVDITDQTDTNFLHLFFGESVNNTVSAVTRVFPSTSSGYGKTLLALDDECQGNDGGIDFSGTEDVTIDTGGIFSNACLDMNGSTGEVSVDDGEIAYITDYTNPSGKPVSPAPITSTVLIDDPLITAPDCDDLSTDYGNYNNHGDQTIDPGRYSRIMVPSGSLTMNPGLYCVTGNFTINSGPVIGEGVTIYIENGDFSIGGSYNVQLSAPVASDVYPFNCISPECPPSIPGVLIYLAQGNTGNVSILGDSTSLFNGTIYAPDGTLNIGGGSSTLTDYGVQGIANTINVFGSTVLDISYDGDEIFHGFIELEVAR